MAVEEQLHGRIRQPDQPQHHCFIADGIDVVGAGDVQNLRVAVAGSGKTRNGIRAAEIVLVLVRDAHERNAHFVRYTRSFEFYDLRNLFIGDVQGFQLFDFAGTHARRVERAVVRERMLLAADGEKHTNHENEGLDAHDSIV